MLHLHRLFPRADTAHVLLIRYRSFPFALRETYRHRIPAPARQDSVERIAGAVTPKPGGGFSFDDLFGSDLQKSGSIIRGLTIGSNRDLSLNSGFRMQMSGNLMRDVGLTAALTDDNSPIQPEGTTRTLQEVDKVFIELRGNDAAATLGDFVLDLPGGEFATLSRKLRGARGTARLGSAGEGADLLISGASARGKYTSNQFPGLDGVQGPYRLTGPGGERDLFIIAGTERVYLDGERMVRGETDDYTIDYAAGEITFTARRLISRASRLTVDFEYSDRQFSRNILGAQAGAALLGGRTQFRATFYQEQDDENSPIDFSLSDADREVLRSAGNDRTRAVRSGIDSVGAGKGQYVRIDTTVRLAGGTDSTLAVYRYNPADSVHAIYSIAFGFVGAGAGDYRRVSLQQYEFAGIGQGDYRPVRFLPLPSSHRVADFNFTGTLTADLGVSAEYARSSFTANRFSAPGTGSLEGGAGRAEARYSPKHLMLGGVDLGSLDIGFKERVVGDGYLSADRMNEVEFDRKWNIPDSAAGREELREGRIGYQPTGGLQLAGTLGTITRGDARSSDRASGTVSFSHTDLPDARWSAEVINDRNSRDGEHGKWVRQQGSVSLPGGNIVPAISYTGEAMRRLRSADDTLSGESFRFNEIAPDLRISHLAGPMSLAASYAWRWEDSLSAGELQPASSLFRQTYGWRLEDWNAVSSSADVTIQHKSFSTFSAGRRLPDLETLLLRWQGRASPLHRGIETDVFYELASEQSGKLERVFERVPKGTGSYIYAGDLNGNHIVDEPDFQLARFDGDFTAFTVPTTDLQPVADVRASTRFRVNGDRLFGPDSWFARGIPLSAETYFRVEEKSTDPDRHQIYTLQFSHFLNDATTLAGSNLFSQDLYAFEHGDAFSVRLRYSQRRGLNQFAASSERTFAGERSVRLRWKPLPEIANQTDYSGRSDNLISPNAPYRSRRVSLRSLTTDWSYRPEQAVELGFTIGSADGENFDSTTASLNTQSVRLTYAMSDRGQGTVQFSREELLLDRPGLAVPFELSGGRVGGKTWLWRLGMDYRFTHIVQGTLSYDGRSEGGQPPVHTARAEVRAFF